MMAKIVLHASRDANDGGMVRLKQKTKYCTKKVCERGLHATLAGALRALACHRRSSSDHTPLRTVPLPTVPLRHYPHRAPECTRRSRHYRPGTDEPSDTALGPMCDL